MKPLNIVAAASDPLKDNYTQLLEKGYKPQDLEKFTKDMQTKTPDKVQPPKPSNPGTKPMAPSTSIGSDTAFLAGEICKDCEKDPCSCKKATITAGKNCEDCLCDPCVCHEPKEDSSFEGCKGCDSHADADTFHPGAGEKKNMNRPMGIPKGKEGSYTASVKYLAGEEEPVQKYKCSLCGKKFEIPEGYDLSEYKDKEGHIVCEQCEHEHKLMK